MPAGGAGHARAPELVAMSTGGLDTDAKGKHLETMAQAYEMADAWAAARTIWEVVSGDDPARQVPEHSTLYEDSAIPRLPQAGRELEAILRGLLQSRPSDRLPPAVAIRALRALLYGPDNWPEMDQAALQHRKRVKSTEPTSGQPGSGAHAEAGPASGAGTAHDPSVGSSGAADASTAAASGGAC